MASEQKSQASLDEKLAELKKLTTQKQQNPKEATAVFKKFQLQLIKVGHKLNTASDLQTAMEGLEIGVQISINVKDLVLFDRVMVQLKQYYLQKELSKLSKMRQHLMGLYLMYLLTENRLGDFHVEIELLSIEDLENKYIKYPMLIEQFMMEGSYGKIIEAKSNKPDDKTYTPFLNKLEQTVRNEISLSLQCVHDKIPIKDALDMLSLNNINTLKQYIKTNKFNWTVNDNTLCFAPIEQQQQQIEATVCAKDMLEFTNNIETIV
eukprot:478644_1